MYIIGERINSTRKAVRDALDNRDAEFLVDEVLRQLEAGASAIDINAAALHEGEREALKWAIPFLQEQFKIPFSIDTPNPASMESGLKVHQGQAILNSLTGESSRIMELLPLIKQFRPRTIILCMDDSGLPQTPEQELSIAQKMAELMDREGIDLSDIFLDPLVRPIGVYPESGRLFLDSLTLIKENLPQVNTIAGVSNVSFGMPGRKLINRSFLTLAMGRGLDAAILDPLDKEIISAVKASRALLGHDPAMREYLEFIRSSKI
jgi:cobalamin-dependent methionine synthase I